MGRYGERYYFLKRQQWNLHKKVETNIHKSYTYSDCHFFTEKDHFLNSAKSSNRRACDSSDQIHSCKSCCIYDKIAVFVSDIVPMHLYKTSKTCCRHIFCQKKKKKTRIICQLLQKDLCKMSHQLLAVMIYHMMSKSNCGQKDFTTDVANIYIHTTAAVAAILSSQLDKSLFQFLPIQSWTMPENFTISFLYLLSGLFLLCLLFLWCYPTKLFTPSAIVTSSYVSSQLPFL